MDLLAVQGTLKSLLQHHSSKASVLQNSDFLTVQLSHPYMTTGKTVALTKWTFVGKADIAFLPRSKCLLISWLQSPSAVILEPKNTIVEEISIFSSFISAEKQGPGHFIFSSMDMAVILGPWS